MTYKRTLCVFSQAHHPLLVCCRLSFRHGGAFQPPHPVCTITCSSSLIFSPFLDRSHGSDAWPHPCARSVRLNRAPDSCQALAPFWLTRQLYIHTHLAPRAAIFFVTHRSLCGVRTLTTTTHPLYPSSWYRRKRERTRLHNRNCGRITPAIKAERTSLPFCQTLLHLQQGKVSLSAIWMAAHE